MTFTNSFRLIGFTVVLLLSGCASFDMVQDEQPENPESAKSENAQRPQLTAFETLALDLKQQSNLYARNKPFASESVRRGFEAAVALRKQGKIKQAKQAFQAIISQHKSLSGPHVQLGDMRLASADKERFSQAEQHYKQAIAVNQYNYHARNRLALVLREQGKFKQAEFQYQKALASWPAFQPAYLNLGILYDLYLGDKAKALENYQIYQALNDQPERRVKGWIADLSRQVNSQKTSQLAEAK